MRPGIRLRPSTFVFLAVLFLTGAVSLPAYVPLRWSGNGARGAWTAARFPLTFYLNDVTARGLPNVTAGSDPAAAVRAALSSWQSIQTAVVRFTDLRLTPAASAATDGINLITMADTQANREILGGDLGAVSLTRLVFDPATGEITEADILLNPACRFSADLSPGTYDLQTVVTHELGHALGSDHSPAQNDTMFSLIAPGDFHQRNLSGDAVAFAETTYPDRTRTGSLCLISGRVTAGGKGVFGASVTALNLERNQIYTALTEPDGSYTMRGPTAGYYAIYAEPLDGPATPDQLVVQGSDAFYKGLNTTFRTVFAPRQALGTGGAPRQITVDLAVPSGSLSLNIERLGRGDPDTGLGYLAAGPVVLSPGDLVNLWISGQNIGKVAGVGDIEILGTGVSVEYSRGLRVLDGSIGVSVFIRVAADAPPGARTVTVKVGDQQAASTGGIVVAPRGLPASTLYFPYLVADAKRYTGLAFANPASGTPATIRVTGRDAQGALIWDEDALVPNDFTLAGGAQVARLERQIFNLPDDTRQSGSVTVESDSPDLRGFFLAGDVGRNVLDGAVAFTRGFRQLYFLDVLQNADTATEIHLLNTQDVPEVVDLSLMDQRGAVLKGPIRRTIPGRGKIGEPVSSLFGYSGNLVSAHVKVTAADDVLAGFCLVIQPDAVFGLNALPAEDAGPVLYSPQLAVGYLGLHFDTRLNVVNAGDARSTATVALLDEESRPLAPPRNFTLEAGGQMSFDVSGLFGLAQGQGYIRISTAGGRLLGNVVFGDGDPASSRIGFGAALPLSATGDRSFLFAHVAQGAGYYTGVAFLAPDGAKLTIEAYDSDGIMLGSATPVLAPGQRLVSLLPGLIPETAGHVGGYVKVISDRPVIGFELFGSADGQVLSAVPPQRLEK